MMGTGQRRKEVCTQMRSLANSTRKVKIVCWNTAREGNTAQQVTEARSYGLVILGISECRWSGFGRVRTRYRITHAPH